MSSIVLINGLDKKTLSGYVVFSVEKQKKEIIFRNWQKLVKYLININSKYIFNVKKERNKFVKICKLFKKIDFLKEI